MGAQKKKKENARWKREEERTWRQNRDAKSAYEEAKRKYMKEMREEAEHLEAELFQQRRLLQDIKQECFDERKILDSELEHLENKFRQLHREKIDTKQQKKDLEVARYFLLSQKTQFGKDYKKIYSGPIQPSREER